MILRTSDYRKRVTVKPLLLVKVVVAVVCAFEGKKNTVWHSFWGPPNFSLGTPLGTAALERQNNF